MRVADTHEESVAMMVHADIQHLLRQGWKSMAHDGPEIFTQLLDGHELYTLVYLAQAGNHLIQRFVKAGVELPPPLMTECSIAVLVAKYHYTNGVLCEEGSERVALFHKGRWVTHPDRVQRG